MTDLILKLVSDHGLAAIFGIASLALQLWVARSIFANQAGTNQALRVLFDALPQVQSLPPSKPRRRRGLTGILPRAPTPLPFWPIKLDDKGDEK
jgi:hypothetical protein